MIPKKVSAVLTGTEVPVGDMNVHQAFPSYTDGVRFIDPFILLHHAKITISPNVDLRHAGVGPHPHRGFSPVSFIFAGGVHHRDSMGNDSTIYAGGVQWMNSGSGVIHSERPPLDIFKLGGEQELIQMWVNTPRGHKADTPAYFPLSKDDTPKHTSNDGLVEMYVQAGNILKVKGPIPTPSPVNSSTIYLKAGGEILLPIEPGFNAFIYILSGEVEVSGTLVGERLAATFESEGDGISLKATADSRALFMCGKPLKEPVVAHGNFVMNSEAEIKQAWLDFQSGKMGELEW
ncbi:MAG: pirin-like C-terminal cupin domain-containing protein [bacterium]